MLIESEVLKNYCKNKIKEFESPPPTDMQMWVAAGINDVLVTIEEIEKKQQVIDYMKRGRRY